MYDDSADQRMTNGVTPHITIADGRAADAVHFYEEAFGAREMVRHMADDGLRIMFVRLRVNGGTLMLSDQFPESDCATADAVPNAVPMVIHLQVDDADYWWERALHAGADVRLPISDQFWGDRYGQLIDPFGYVWALGSRNTTH